MSQIFTMLAHRKSVYYLIVGISVFYDFLIQLILRNITCFIYLGVYLNLICTPFWGIYLLNDYK